MTIIYEYKGWQYPGQVSVSGNIYSVWLPNHNTTLSFMKVEDGRFTPLGESDPFLTVAVAEAMELYKLKIT